MFDRIELGIEFFEGLTAIDAAIVERAAAEKCRDCGGPLHRAGRAHHKTAGVAGADHDGEHARRITFAAGSRMTDRAPPRSRRRWRYPCFLALA